MNFTVRNVDGLARLGEISFPRGIIKTPAFMPVGTYGSVKGLNPSQIRSTGADIILAIPIICLCDQAKRLLNCMADCINLLVGRGLF